MKIKPQQLLLTLLIAYLAFDFLYNQYRISMLHYGVKANALREALHVPIIDHYMKAQNRYNEFYNNSWYASRELPKDTLPLHVWKIVTPLSDTSGLDTEWDAYRKKYNDHYLQMNIYSKVMGDTIAGRHGKLFFHNSPKMLNIDLSEAQIDSIAKSWGLTYLVRGK